MLVFDHNLSIESQLHFLMNQLTLFVTVIIMNSQVKFHLRLEL